MKCVLGGLAARRPSQAGCLTSKAKCRMSILRTSFGIAVDVQQRLNCALPSPRAFRLADNPENFRGDLL